MRQAHAKAPHGPGFSLVELLAAMAISALLACLGWPLLERQRAAAAVAVATNRTLAALHLARQQALSSGNPVTVCPSPDGLRCGFGGTRWLIFENRPGGLDATRDPGEPLLQQWELPPGVRVGGTRGYAVYLPGTRSASTLTFDFCHPAHPATLRSVIVSQTGRARVSRPTPASSPGVGRCPR